MEKDDHFEEATPIESPENPTASIDQITNPSNPPVAQPSETGNEILNSWDTASLPTLCQLDENIRFQYVLQQAPIPSPLANLGFGGKYDELIGLVNGRNFRNFRDIFNIVAEEDSKGNNKDKLRTLALQNARFRNNGEVGVLCWLQSGRGASKDSSYVDSDDEGGVPSPIQFDWIDRDCILSLNITEVGQRRRPANRRIPVFCVTRNLDIRRLEPRVQSTVQAIRQSTRGVGYFLLSTDRAPLVVNGREIEPNTVVGPLPDFATIELGDTPFFWWRRPAGMEYVPGRISTKHGRSEDIPGCENLGREGPPSKKQKTNEGSHKSHDRSPSVGPSKDPRKTPPQKDFGQFSLESPLKGVFDKWMKARASTKHIRSAKRSKRARTAEVIEITVKISDTFNQKLNDKPNKESEPKETGFEKDKSKKSNPNDKGLNENEPKVRGSSEIEPEEVASTKSWEDNFKARLRHYRTSTQNIYDGLGAESNWHKTGEPSKLHDMDVSLAIAAVWSGLIRRGTDFAFGEMTLFQPTRLGKGHAQTCVRAGHPFIMPLLVTSGGYPDLEPEEFNNAKPPPSLKTKVATQQGKWTNITKQGNKMNSSIKKLQEKKKTAIKNVKEQFVFAVAERGGIQENQIRLRFMDSCGDPKYIDRRIIRRTAREVIRNSNWLPLGVVPNFRLEETWHEVPKRLVSTTASGLFVILNAWSYMLNIPVSQKWPDNHKGTAAFGRFYKAAKDIIELALEGRANSETIRAFLQYSGYAEHQDLTALRIEEKKHPDSQQGLRRMQSVLMNTEIFQTIIGRLQQEEANARRAETTSSTEPERSPSIEIPDLHPFTAITHSSTEWFEIASQGIRDGVQQKKNSGKRFVEFARGSAGQTHDNVVLAIAAVWQGLRLSEPPIEYGFAIPGTFRIFADKGNAKGAVRLTAVGQGHPLIIPLLFGDDLFTEGKKRSLGHLALAIATRVAGNQVQLTVMDSLNGIANSNATKSDPIATAAQKIVRLSGWMGVDAQGEPLEFTVEPQFKIHRPHTPHQTGNECGIHVILNAWSYMLGIPVSPTANTIDRSVFYQSAVHLINVVLAGFANSWTIEAFLRGWRYAASLVNDGSVKQMQSVEMNNQIFRNIIEGLQLGKERGENAGINENGSIDPPRPPFGSIPPQVDFPPSQVDPPHLPVEPRAPAINRSRKEWKDLADQRIRHEVELMGQPQKHFVKIDGGTAGEHNETVVSAIATVWQGLRESTPRVEFGFATHFIFQWYTHYVAAGAESQDLGAAVGHGCPFVIPLSLGMTYLKQPGDEKNKAQESLTHHVLAIATHGPGNTINLSFMDSRPRTVNFEGVVCPAAQNMVRRSGWLGVDGDGRPLPLPIEPRFRIRQPQTPAQGRNGNKCGVHVILNAWSYMLGIPISASWNVSGLKQPAQDNWYKQAEQLINLALNGRTDSDTIEAFLRGYSYAELRDIVDGGVRQMRTVPMRDGTLDQWVLATQMEEKYRAQRREAQRAEKARQSTATSQGGAAAGQGTSSGQDTAGQDTAGQDTTSQDNKHQDGGGEGAS